MRIALFAATATFVTLTACRGPEANEVNNTAAASNTAAAKVAQPLGAAVSGDDAKRIMDERHEGMEEIGDAFKALSGAVKATNPDLAKLQEEAATMARLAPEVSDWFPPGTGPDVGKTRAKAEIWQKPEDFAAKRNAFQQAAQAFNAAAQSGDVAAIKARHGDLGKSCKACHDLYRTEKKRS